MSLLKTIASAVIISLVFCSFTIANAVEDQFEINLTVTGSSDVTAPSTPTGLSATAVSTSQIDLSWTASTDNVAVTGYRIYRDSVFITTSAGTTYSDTGLSSNTTYSYAVSATDAASNESSQSSSASATTFSESASSGGGGSGQSVAPYAYDIVIVPALDSAVISWKTNQPALSTLSWGVTSNLEMGSMTETLYGTEHSATISGLSPATVYLFSIYMVSGYGRAGVSPINSFQTLSLAEYLPNPTNFVAVPKDSSIALNWNNPIDPRFDEVRLVRGEGFYPSDPNDGEVLYEGSAEDFEDENVVIGERYYYALFAKDGAGTYSSGVLASARIPVKGETPQPEEGVFDGLPKAPGVHPEIEKLAFLDFDFIQEGKRITSFTGGGVAIDGGKNLTVSLDYSKVPEVLKSVVITLVHPADSSKTFSFLLRVNPEKTAYSATIGPLGDSGKYGLRIAIVDYKNRGLKEIVGDLFASAGVLYTGDSWRNALVLFITEHFINILLLLILLALLIKAFLLTADKKKRQEPEGKKNLDSSKVLESSEVDV
ncbi:MAG: hypothetical protein A2741_00625 [Candidatus Zambryskibacteria bacterium RIFCSPHIGHO2_01_FULL_43_27]|uniref:Fibronectin type-III domain-containing protein n=1 Tax=Candidatus Zambryskibacteria bacterium RIFCSPLOWO2_01_FULL_43_17 TaxID=1802760 RepID=A0A1G2U5I5_9BACT|nr:MAG: hypothetical protein A2741_00625 [Candidatus Zambryskibacteria bacterium RIFCSPHIGHO2_01_FULL_43_27]OHB04132.1 MAG: hypothetical protein A2920_02220 [Candidatus Zambryskibacteria bacterium RIFCSPLOWO2_01_FULL_43_17]